MKTDSRGRIRFTKYGFRFELKETDPTEVAIYKRTGKNFNNETKLGTVRLTTAAFRLLFGTEGDSVVKPTRPTFVLSDGSDD